MVHEVLYRDRLNLDPRNLINGTRAALTRSATARRDDLILKQAGHVVGRFQLKDTVGSVRETVRQVADGKYARTVLVGTTETAAAYAAETARQASHGAKVTQAIRSSGISSADTAHVAAKALGQLPGGVVLVSAARSTGLVGAGIGAAVEVVSSGRELLDGRISGGEFAGRVAKEGAKNGVSAAAATLASTAATAGTATFLAATAISAPVLVPLAVGAGTAFIVGGAVKGC